MRFEQADGPGRGSGKPQWPLELCVAESKNASVVRKHMGYSHIPQKYAKPINAFYEGVFNPWLNMHRPASLPQRS